MANFSTLFDLLQTVETLGIFLYNWVHLLCNKRPNVFLTKLAFWPQPTFVHLLGNYRFNGQVSYPDKRSSNRAEG